AGGGASGYTAFAVAPGEVFGLLGPNGAGKSTTIGMLTTTVVPTAGTARLAGFDLATQPRAARRRSAVVFQEPVVDRALTGRRNLEIHGRLFGLDAATARARSAEVGERFGLAGLLDRPVGTFSGGQRRRLEIARALLSRPAVLFLDEPTVGPAPPPPPPHAGCRRRASPAPTPSPWGTRSPSRCTAPPPPGPSSASPPSGWPPPPSPPGPRTSTTSTCN